MDKAYASAIARKLHPDLDWPEPDEQVKDRLTRIELQEQLDDLIRVFGCADIDLPGYSPSIATTIYCTIYDYSKIREDNNYVDVEASRKKLAKNVRALKSLGAKITKDYQDTSMRVNATFDSGLVIACYVDRSTMCKKKVVDKVWVEPTHGHYRDVVEWDCERVPLMAIDYE